MSDSHPILDGPDTAHRAMFPFSEHENFPAHWKLLIRFDEIETGMRWLIVEAPEFAEWRRGSCFERYISVKRWREDRQYQAETYQQMMAARANDSIL